MKTKNLLFILLLLATAVGVKADPKVLSYGWDDWTSAKAPSARYWKEFFTGDDRLLAHRHYTYSFEKVKVNGVQCVTFDFEDPTSFVIKIPANLQGATVTIEGFAGIDDSYSDHNGYLKISKAYKDPNGSSQTQLNFNDSELLKEVAKDGKFVETGESYGVKTPFSVTVHCTPADYVHMIGKDMYISKVQVTYTADFTGSVKNGDEPIAGAEISLSGSDRNFHCTTDENGEYILPSVGAGTFMARVSHTSAFDDYCTDLTFSDTPLDQNFTLTATPQDDGRTHNSVNFSSVESNLQYINATNKTLYNFRENMTLINPNESSVSTSLIYNYGTSYGKGGAVGFAGINTPKSHESILVLTHLRTNGNGELAFEAKRIKDTASGCNIYKMTRNADGEFEKGELIASFSDNAAMSDSDHGHISATDWTKLVLDGITEDGWVGIELQNVQISDIVNSFPKDTPGDYNTTAVYDFKYTNAAPTEQRNACVLREGLVMNWGSANNNTKNAISFGYGITFGTNGYGFATIPVYSKGKAKLTIEIMSQKVDSKKFLNIASTTIDDEGNYKWVNLLEKLVDNSIVLGSGLDMSSYGVTSTLEIYLPEGGLYSLHGKNLSVKALTVDYISDTASLSGKLTDGDRVLSGLTVEMKGPAGKFSAISDDEGKYTFENVPDGNYEVSVNTGRREMLRTVVVREGIADIDLAFTPKPVGYTEDVDDFETITGSDKLAASEKWTLLPETADFTKVGTAYGMGTYESLALQWTTSTEASEEDYMLVTKVKGAPEGAGIKVDVAASSYNKPGNRYNKKANLSLYKMIKNEDGSFTKGELLTDFVKDHQIVADDVTLTDNMLYYTVDYPSLTEDCYIGLRGECVTIDNFVNYYVVPSYELFVSVVDEEGQAVADAEVAVTCGEESLALKSDAQGKLVATVFADEVAGKTWTATATAPLYEQATEEFVIDADKSLTLTLNPIIYNVSLAVEDAEGESVADAVVTLTCDEEEVKPEAGEEGLYTATFKAPAVHGKTWTAYATAHGYQDTDWQFTFEGEPIEHTLVLDAIMRTYTATVTDEKGTPIAHATMSVTDHDGKPIDLTAAGTGSFTFSLPLLAVEGVTYTAAAKAADYEDGEPQTFTLADADVSHTHILKAVVSIDGISAEGAAVINRQGRLWIAGNADIYDMQGRLVRRVSNSADAPAEVLGLPAGLYLVGCTKVSIR